MRPNPSLYLGFVLFSFLYWRVLAGSCGLGFLTRSCFPTFLEVFCETTGSVTTFGSPPLAHYKARTTERPCLGSRRKAGARALHYDDDYNDYSQRENENKEKPCERSTSCPHDPLPLYNQHGQCISGT